MKAIPEEQMPYYRCPSHDRCSTNQCPLDTLYHERPNCPGDDRRCHSRKATRLRIVEELRREGNPAIEHLPYGGLTAREERGRLAAERFAALPPEEQERVRQLMRRHGFSPAVGPAGPVTSPHCEAEAGSRAIPPSGRAEANDAE